MQERKVRLVETKGRDKVIGVCHPFKVGRGTSRRISGTSRGVCENLEILLIYIV